MQNFKTFIELYELYEIFDSSLELLRHKSLEDSIKDKYYPHTLTNIEAYHTEHHEIPYVFIRCKHKDAWEVHYSRADENSTTGLEPLNKHKGSEASHLVGTAIKLYREKLDRDQPIRYVGANAHLTRLYDKAFNHISKKHYKSNLHMKKINNFVNHDGKETSATEIHTYNAGQQSLHKQIQNENYENPYKKLD